MGSYAPRSPDFSAYQSAPAQPSQSLPYSSDSFAQPSSYYSSIPQPSYYPQQTLQVPQQGQQQPLHGSNDDHSTSHAGFPQTNNDGFRASAAMKQEDSSWGHQHHNDMSSNAHVGPATGRGRGSGASTLKTEQSAATRIKNEPRIPAPGEEEGIEVKTKFPVARIKRIVQADEDVGKVAQVTPVVISKALELFMISITLSAAEEAKARGSKRVSGHHLKQVVQKAEQFDFLRDIVARIPDAPTSKEGKSKGDNSDDGEFEEKEKKPRKGRPSGSGGGKRRKRTEREES